MSQQLAYLSNDSSLLNLALQTRGASCVVDRDGGIDGWGLGYYHDDRALVRKKPSKMVGRFDICELAGDAGTHSWLAHVRFDADGSSGPSNIQPFRFRNWLFGLTGDDGQYDDGQGADDCKELTALLPDFLRRNVRGKTLAEPMLHLFFDALRHAGGRLEGAVQAPELLAAALQTAYATATRVLGRDPGVDMLFTSGRMIAAVHGSSRRFCTHSIEGAERTEPVLFAGHEPKPSSFPHFRGVFVGTDPNETAEWTDVEQGQVVVVDDRYAIHTFPLAA